MTEPRNAIVLHGDDRDHGPGTNARPIPGPTPDEISAIAALKFKHLMQMLQDQAFDYTHPVDEYAPQGNPGLITQVNVQSDYDMPERIEAITYVLPSGTLTASLQLGQRTLSLYGITGVVGAAAPIVASLQVDGIILNSDDPRTLNLTYGTGTVAGNSPYLGLTGWALTRGQFS